LRRDPGVPERAGSKRGARAMRPGITRRCSGLATLAAELHSLGIRRSASRTLGCRRVSGWRRALCQAPSPIISASVATHDITDRFRPGLRSSRGPRIGGSIRAPVRTSSGSSSVPSRIGQCNSGHMYRLVAHRPRRNPLCGPGAIGLARIGPRSAPGLVVVQYRFALPHTVRPAMRKLPTHDLVAPVTIGGSGAPMAVCLTPGSSGLATLAA